MIVRVLIDNIHSAYLRALKGMTLESFNKVISVNESTSSLNNSPQISKGGSKWNPKNWGKD